MSYNNNNQRRYNRNYKQRFTPRQNQDTPVESPESILASLLFQIGESEESVEQNIEQLVKSLESKLPLHKETLLNLIIPIIFAQPVKTSMYGILIGLLNAKVPDLGQEIIVKLSETFKEAFNAVDPYKIRLLLRFCSELIDSNVIESESFINVLEDLTKQCDPTQNGKLSSGDGKASDNVCSARSELFLSVLLDILPFCGKSLCSLNKERFSIILKTLNNIFNTREEQIPQTARKILSVFNQGNNIALNWAQDKWNQLKNALHITDNDSWDNIDEDSWNIFDNLIVKPNKEYFSTQLDQGKPCILQDIEIPDHNIGHKYNRRLQSVFRIFDSSKTDDLLPPAGRIIVEQYIIDLFCALNSSHKICMKNILDLELGNNNIPNHLLVEILFGQILELPSPPYRRIYYGNLIVDGYKTSKDFADTLSEAVNIIYYKLSELDTECFDRFSEWFSFHLSSIDWKWNWENWSDVLNHSESSHQRKFISEVIRQCLRLSYHQRILKTIPDSFHILMPQQSLPSYSYTDSPIASSLLERVYERATGDELNKFLEESELSSNDEKLDMLFQVLLQRGHKSTTHILKLFERYLSLFQNEILNVNQKITVLNAVQTFWINNQQNIIIIIDKLMTYCIVDNISIIKWILTSKSASQLKYGYMWIILRKTFEKTLARLDTIELRIQQYEKNEIKLDDDPRDPEIVKDRKLTVLKEQKEKSQKELQNLLLTAINDFCVLMESPVVVQDIFLSYRVKGHLTELLRKHSLFVSNLMRSEDTRSQLLITASEEVAQFLEATKYL